MKARPKTIRDVLLVAARLLERRGWCRGAYEKNGRLCVIGAMRLAVKGDANKFSGLAYDASVKFGDTIGELAWDWNDRVAKSRSAVVQALRKAATAS